MLGPVESRTIVAYKRQMAAIKRTAAFERWLARLPDQRGRAKILARFDRLLEGNPGDVRWIGAGVFEMRIDFGPGYRVYYKDLHHVYVMLLGGNKASQKRDIEKALALADELEG